MPSDLRTAYRLDPGLVFLNHGSFGACAAEVLAAQRAWQDALERNPVEFLGRRSGGLLRAARERPAPVLGADAQDLAFVPNATQGVGIAVATLERAGLFGTGDEIVLADHEYGACETLLADAARRHGATLRRVALPGDVDDAEALERIGAAFGPRTRLLFVSQITSPTARELPVAALVAEASRRGIESVVDAAHAPGQRPVALDAVGAAFSTGNLHKWIGAPRGAAFLHVRRDWHARVVPPVLGWGARAEAGERGHEPYVGDSVLERRLQWLGTRDPSAWLAVPAALDFHARALLPGQARCRALAQAAADGLAALGGRPAKPWRRDDRLQMAAIPIDTADAGALKDHLFEAHRIEVPVTRLQPAGGGPVRHFLRVSVQAYNDESDIAALVAAMRSARERGLWS